MTTTLASSTLCTRTHLILDDFKIPLQVKMVDANLDNWVGGKNESLQKKKKKLKQIIKCGLTGLY